MSNINLNLNPYDDWKQNFSTLNIPAGTYKTLRTLRANFKETQLEKETQDKYNDNIIHKLTDKYLDDIINKYLNTHDNLGISIYISRDIFNAPDRVKNKISNILLTKLKLQNINYDNILYDHFETYDDTIGNKTYYLLIPVKS